MVILILVSSSMFYMCYAHSLNEYLNNNNITAFRCDNVDLSHTHPLPQTPHCLPPGGILGEYETEVALYKKDPSSLTHVGCICSSSVTSKTCHGSTWSIFGEYTKWSKTVSVKPNKDVCISLCQRAKVSKQVERRGLIGPYTCKVWSEKVVNYQVHLARIVKTHQNEPGGPLVFPGISANCDPNDETCSVSDINMLVNLDRTSDRICAYMEVGRETCHITYDATQGYIMCPNSGRAYTVHHGQPPIYKCDRRMYVSSEGYLIRVARWTGPMPDVKIADIPDSEIWNKMTNTYIDAKFSYFARSINEYTSSMKAQYVYDRCVREFTRISLAHAISQSSPSNAARLYMRRGDVVGRIKGRSIEYGVCERVHIKNVSVDHQVNRGKCGRRYKVKIEEEDLYLDPEEMTLWREQIYGACYTGTQNLIYTDGRYFSLDHPDDEELDIKEPHESSIPTLHLTVNYTKLYNKEEIQELYGVNDLLNILADSQDATRESLKIDEFGAVSYDDQNTENTVYKPPNIPFRLPSFFKLNPILTSIVITIGLLVLIFFSCKILYARAKNRRPKEKDSTDMNWYKPQNRAYGISRANEHSFITRRKIEQA